MKLTKYFAFAALFALVILGIGAIKDETGTTRYRGNAVLTLDPTVVIRDEDSAWTLTMTKLAALANGGSSSIGWTASTLTLGATTNQVTFGGTNTAPADVAIVKWVSVTVAGETNKYRIGLAW